MPFNHISRLSLSVVALALSSSALVQPALAQTAPAQTTSAPATGTRYGTFGIDLTAADASVKAGDDFWTRGIQKK